MRDPIITTRSPVYTVWLETFPDGMCWYAATLHHDIRLEAAGATVGRAVRRLRRKMRKADQLAKVAGWHR